MNIHAPNVHPVNPVWLLRQRWGSQTHLLQHLFLLSLWFAIHGRQHIQQQFLLLLMRYALATWEVRDLLLIPSFMFSESAVIKRKPLAATARRAGWVGCNIDLHRIAPEARIDLVRTIGPQGSAAVPAASLNLSAGRRDACATVIVPPEEVRARYTRLKPIREIKTPKAFGAGRSTC